MDKAQYLAEVLKPIQSKIWPLDIQFDYTEWQRNLFGDMPLDEFLKNADEYSKTTEA
jgi:hypothetical protein